MESAINLKEKLTKFNDYWSPRVISELNDYQIKLAKFKGEFTWHAHQETDELFYVVSGSLRIEFTDGYIELNEGDLHVIPKGKEHKPVTEEECHVLIIEPKGVVNTGTSDSELKADNDVWI